MLADNNSTERNESKIERKNNKKLREHVEKRMIRTDKKFEKMNPWRGHTNRTVRMMARGRMYNKKSDSYQFGELRLRNNRIFGRSK